MISRTAIRSFVQGIQFKEPRLYDALIAIIDRLENAEVDIQEVQRELTTTLAEVTSESVPSVSIFYYLLNSDYVKLIWERPNQSPTYLVPTSFEEVMNYEIRYGSDWDTAQRLIITNTTSALFDPLTVGTHTYLIKSIGSSGNYSPTSTSLQVIIPPIAAVSLTSRVIDNNVLLFWNAPTSTFRISYYITGRNGAAIGTKDGTFTSYFEQTSGTYIYSITPVDIAGNQGAVAEVSVIVNQPPDYVLHDIIDSIFTGTITNGVVDDGRLLVCVDATETWQDHFDDNSWTTIQDQLDDGYDYYIEPCETTGEYEEIFDFGIIIANVIINIDWSVESIVDTVTQVCKIATSEDNITYSAFETTSSLFATSVRYVKVKLEFTGGIKKLAYIFNLSARLDVKRETDAGTIEAVSTDASGTEVTFNKAFKDVESIIITAESTEPIYPVYDFVDVPNPTSFYVLVFDSSGNRITRTVSWMARGII